MDTGHCSVPYQGPDRVRWEPNLLTLSKEPRIEGLGESVSINEIIGRNNLVFTRPYFCTVDGKWAPRPTWDQPLSPGCTVHFVELPRGGGGGSQVLRIIALIAVAALAFWLAAPTGALATMIGQTGAAIVGGIVGLGGSMLINAFLAQSAVATTGDVDQTDVTTYALSTSNQMAVNSPVPEHFGRYKFYPPLAQAMYTVIMQEGETVNGMYNHEYDQYLYFLGIIGVGEYEVNGVYIEDTPFEDYDDADFLQYQVLPPGTKPNLVTTSTKGVNFSHASIFYVSAEVSGQELSTEWISYVVNPPKTKVFAVLFDITFPTGLGQWDKAGNDLGKSVTVQAQVRGLDSDGDPVDSWTDVWSYRFYAQTTHPISMQLGFIPPWDRYQYEVRWRRSPAKETNHKGGALLETVNLSSLKVRSRGHPNYGDVTMIEISMRASERLSGNVANRIRVDATRKLYPVTETGLGETKVATSCPADAMAYMVTAENGANQDPEGDFVDWSALYEFKTGCASRGDEFNYRFNSRCSVMEACAKAALCGRAVPFMPGGQFSVVRDELQSSPVQIYGDDDISEGSLVLSHAFRTTDDYTCVEVQYIDPDTWETKSIYCYDSDGSEENPWTRHLEGCIDIDHAYREGTYWYLDNKLNRTKVEFTTGLKGHIPMLGEKVLVASRIINWAQTGIVIALDGSVLTLSEPVDFDGAAEAVIMLTTPGGGVSGPHTVTPGQSTHVIFGDWTGLTINTLETNGEQATRFMFGASVDSFIPVRVTRVLPQSVNEIRIIGSTIDDSVYEDPGDAPGEDEEENDLLMSVILTFVDIESGTYEYTLRWSGDAEEVLIEINEGSGYSTLEDNYTSRSLTIYTTVDAISVRVTPYEDSVLITAEAIVVSSTGFGAPTGFTYDGYANEAVSFSWDAVTGAIQYRVAIYCDGDLFCEKVQSSSQGESMTINMSDIYEYWYFIKKSWENPYATMKLNPCDVYLYAYLADTSTDNPLGMPLAVLRESKPASIEVTLGAPAAPDNFALVEKLQSGVVLSWDAVSDADDYVVCMGTSTGFDPATEGTLKYTGTAKTCTINNLDMSGDYAYYFVVAGRNEIFTAASELNFSEEAVAVPDSALEIVYNDSDQIITKNSGEYVYIEA